MPAFKLDENLPAALKLPLLADGQRRGQFPARRVLTANTVGLPSAGGRRVDRHALLPSECASVAEGSR